MIARELGCQRSDARPSREGAAADGDPHELLVAVGSPTVGTVDDIRDVFRPLR